MSCSICIESLFDTFNGIELCATNCGHVFHKKCLNQWLSKSQKCPLCNAISFNTIKIFLTNTSSNVNTVSSNFINRYKKEYDFEKLTLEQFINEREALKWENSQLVKINQEIVLKLKNEKNRYKKLKEEMELKVAELIYQKRKGVFDVVFACGMISIFIFILHFANKLSL